MKKYILLILCVFGVTRGAYTQQERQVSQYMYDLISINPGSAGSNDMISTHAIIRQQWVGFEGAPEDIVLNLNAPFKLFKKQQGVGLSIYSDKIGFNNDIDLTVSYAYQFTVGDGRLGLGLSAGFLNRKLDAIWDIPNEPPLVPPSSDGAIPDEKQNEFTVDFGAGLFYRTDELYVGLSSTHILQDEFVYNKSSNGSVSKDQFIRNYYFTSGYNLQLPNPAWELIPSMFIQSDLRITKIDLNATFMYNKKFWAGVTYRVGSAVVGMIGMDILNGVKVGYAYDFATSPISQFSKGSHEIMVGYSFKIGIEKAPEKYKSIRYL